MEDNAIVELYFARNEDAIRLSSEKYGRLLLKIADGITGSREDGEECVNETYMRAWNSIPPTRPASLKAYLGRIVRNIALNCLEKSNALRRGGRNAIFEELTEMIPDGTDVGNGAKSNVECLIEAKELSELIARWLDGLSKEDRILFVRRYWYADNLNELAQAMGTTANKLAGRLFRLREKLRGELMKEGVYL